MRQIIKLFTIGLKQITKDGMLFVLLFIPFVVGLVFKFIVPFANVIIIETLSFSLVPWYGLIDGMLIFLTPMFTAVVCAFLFLEERDEGIGAFYQISPVAGYSYLAARIVIPIVWAFLITIVSLLLFNVSSLSLISILSCSFIGTLTGLLFALILVSVADNRLEGLALSKLMGIVYLGIVLVWFIPAPYHFIVAFLPSFWIGKILLEGPSLFAFILGILLAFFWIACFTKKFLSRIA